MLVLTQERSESLVAFVRSVHSFLAKWAAICNSGLVNHLL